MSKLPEVPKEELYKHLYEKMSEESRQLREQLVMLELLATKLRDERDIALDGLADQKDTKSSEPLPDLVVE